MAAVNHLEVGVSHLGGWGEPPGRLVGSEFNFGYRERTH